MKTKAEDIVEHLLETDKSIPTAKKARLLALLRSEPDALATSRPETIVTRAEFAMRANVTERAVDMWAKQGVIPKVRLPGRTRGLGFRASDVDRLLAGLNTERAAGFRASEVDGISRQEVGNEE